MVWLVVYSMYKVHHCTLCSLLLRRMCAGPLARAHPGGYDRDGPQLNAVEPSGVSFVSGQYCDSTILVYCTVLYSTVQYLDTVLNSTVQHRTVPVSDLGLDTQYS